MFMKDTDLVDIVKIVDSLKDIKKWDQWEPLRFEDLTPEQIKSLTWKQWEDWPRWPVWPRWEFSDLTKEQRNELTLKFSHLTEQDKDELRLRFEHLTETQIDELKLKFKHLTKEDKEELRLKFEDLTEANKKELKWDKWEPFKFTDLTKEQKKEIEWKQWDKGDKWDDWLSAYELAKKNWFKWSETQWLATLKGRDWKDWKSIQVTEQSLKKHKHSTWDITWLEEYVQDVIWNSLVEWTNITIDYDDITWETTINSTWWGGWASSTEITQTWHWFIQTERLYFDETDDTYKKAQSDSVDTLWAWHVVEVVDANTFKIAKEWVHEIPNTLDLWEYVLSQDTAWGYTQTLPWDLWDYVLYWMEVISSTHISFYTVPAIQVWDTWDWVQSVVAWTWITVDNTDPLNPIINATWGSWTVTSVAISGSDWIEIDSGSPVTTTWTIALWVNKTAMLTHLNVEDWAEVNNISDANATDLTDWNDTTLHTHDWRYYTETEIDTLLSWKVDENISITWATKTKITYDAKGLVTAWADATTADIADSSNKRYVTDADITKIWHITVTQAVDLDQMESDIAALANGMVYKGNWDASAWTFPWAWVAQTGRFYTVSVGGTVDSIVFNIDDRLVATVDNASTTTYAWNWTKLDATDAVTSVFGRLWNVVATNWDYTASQITNVASGGISAVTVQTAIDELDTEKAPKTSPTFATSINGSYLTASEILITDASKNIVSAPVATYPNLTELSYSKWVTSSIQTQLNWKEPTKWSDDNYVTDAQLVVIGNTSWTNTWDQDLSWLLPKTWWTMSGDIVLWENTSLQLDWVLSADGKWSWTTITATAWYTQAFGDLVYLDPTDSRREATDANAAAWADWDCRGAIGMVVVAWTDWNACTILLQGTIRADANFPTFTIGWPIFASETAWDVTQTSPTTSGNVVKALWRALTADSMYFNPSANFTVVT